LLPRPKTKKVEDVEEKASDPRPGNTGFAAYLEQKMSEFYRKRGATLEAWARQKGLSATQSDPSAAPPDSGDYASEGSQNYRDQQQLYLILYLEHLLYSVGMAVGTLVKFADKKVADGTMAKNRLIWPGWKRLKKWVMNIGREDASVDTESPDSLESGQNIVYLGAGFNKKKDPEHLPPQNSWQKFGNGLRAIGNFLGSTESAFGFRVA
jgi:hypothetical protein